MKTDYTAAIKFRENSIKRLISNPPKEWSAEYVQTNIRTIQKQIKHLKNI